MLVPALAFGQRLKEIGKDKFTGKSVAATKTFALKSGWNTGLDASVRVEDGIPFITFKILEPVSFSLTSGDSVYLALEDGRVIALSSNNTSVEYEDQHTGLVGANERIWHGLVLCELSKKQVSILKRVYVSAIRFNSNSRLIIFDNIKPGKADRLLEAFWLVGL
jgi:hypothetical protein